MPLPVAHGFVGAAVVAALLTRDSSAAADGTRESLRRRRLPLAAGALLANAADLDFVLVFALGSRAWHRGFTHSLAFALVVALTLLVALGRRRARKAAAYGLAYASHALLDFATTKQGGGLELLWPFNADRLGLRWFGLSEIPSRLPPAEVLKALCLEFALFAPPLLFVLWLRGRIDARTEAGGGTA
jgi:inner membrane protein